MPNYEILEPVAPLEKDPEHEAEFLRDSLRVAEVIVNAQEAEIKRLRERLHTDALTGIKNQEGFHEALERRSAESGSETVLMYLDANQFKSINDSFGHEAGDAVIKQVAEYLRGLVREENVARLHGDEFVIMFHNVDEAALRQRFENEELAFIAHYNGQEIPVSLSFGLASRQPDEPIDSWLKRADEDMLAAKQRSGGGR